MRYAYLEHDRPAAFAHRGGNTTAPENTVASFANAVGLGYRYLETDVHLTADGELAAFHDPDLARLIGSPGCISDYTMDEIGQIEIGGGHTIPSMAELLEVFPDSLFNIDPKADDTVEPLAALIQQHGAIRRVGVGSFSDSRIQTIKALLGPELCTSPGPREAWKVLARAYGLPSGRPGEHGCLQVPVRYRMARLTRGLIRRIQAIGYEVHVWTINTEDEMHRILDMGADGLMTDNTELLKEVMVSRGVW